MLALSFQSENQLGTSLIPLSLVMKACKKCRKIRWLEGFYGCKKSRDGKLGYCKECFKKSVRERYHIPEIKSRVLSQQKELNKNPGVKARRKIYMESYLQRPEVQIQSKIRHKEYYQNPEVKNRRKAQAQTPEAKAKKKEYRQIPEVKAQHNRRRRSPEIKSNRNKSLRERRANDPLFRFSSNLRRRIRQGLRGQLKSKPTEQILGSTFEEALCYLEKSFRPPMTRENMGKVWHVDHIRPICSFDLSDPEQVKACFHYTNLQPLFVEENLKKSGKY